MWRLYPDGGCYDTCWLTGLWFTQAKVEGIVPKSARQGGRDKTIINDPLGEPGPTPLYVVLPCEWGPVDSDFMFFPIHRRLILGDYCRHT